MREIQSRNMSELVTSVGNQAQCCRGPSKDASRRHVRIIPQVKGLWSGCVSQRQSLPNVPDALQVFVEPLFWTVAWEGQ